MKIVVLGLSLSSSWGNGHATTWRALIKGLARLGDDVLFLERATPWYQAHCDLIDPPYCKLAFYSSLSELEKKWQANIAQADLVLIGSYVPDGADVIAWALAWAPGRVSFYDIDTPVTLSDLRAGASRYLTHEQIPRFQIYFSFAGGSVLNALVDEFGARKACALYCGVDEESYAPQLCERRWALGYLGTYSADRQDALQELLLEPARALPHLRFVIAGSQYPPEIVWPDNVERIEHLPPREHAAFYSAQAFTLNVTRADMIAAGYSPSVRLFEAACCGAPVISDVWDGLDSIFQPGKEILLARNRNDVIAILTNMIDDEARNQISASARRRTLEAHTGLNRAKQLRCAVLNDDGSHFPPTGALSIPPSAISCAGA